MSEKALQIPTDTVVHVYFKTGTSVEGVVVVWYSDYVVLRAIGGVNNIVIYNPQENLLMVKIVNQPAPTSAPALPPHEEEEEEEPIRELKPVKEKLKQAREDKVNLAKRLREPPRNIAPQFFRYKQPWGKQQ